MIKLSDDMLTILHSPPPTGCSAIGGGQGRGHFCHLRWKKQVGSYLLSFFFFFFFSKFSRERILPYFAALRSYANILSLVKIRFLR